MNSLRQYIIEKFKLNANNITKGLSDKEIDDLIEKYKDKNINGRLYIDLYSQNPSEKSKHLYKMQEYQEKGSKPERLVSSIKNRTKLIGRWNAAMDMGWEDAANVFKQAIIDRGYYTEEDLNQYIIKRMSSSEKNRDHYKVFL